MWPTSLPRFERRSPSAEQRLYPLARHDRWGRQGQEQGTLCVSKMLVAWTTRWR